MSTIFVTGGNGYIGSSISRRLKEGGHRVIVGSRVPLSADKRTDGLKNTLYGDLRQKIDWNRHLSGIDVLVHTAGFVHRREPLSHAEKEDAKLLNENLVKDLAESAVKLGVKQIVFVSTIAVHGTGGNDSPVNELTALLPLSTYAKTKLAGEKQLIQFCGNSATSWTVVRPAMVYGPECPGNFPDLVRAVRSGIPLPFKNVRNNRSFIYIENLVDLIALCIQRPEARNEILVAADPESVSISQMITWIAESLGIGPAMWPFPVPLMRGVARLIGMQARLSSLVDDFVVDGQKARNLLGWQPRYDTHAGVLRSVS